LEQRLHNYGLTCNAVPHNGTTSRSTHEHPPGYGHFSYRHNNFGPPPKSDKHDQDFIPVQITTTSVRTRPEPKH
jgi:hypothetical protein